MMQTMVERLPDWSATTDPSQRFDVAALARAAAAFVRLPTAERDAWVAEYSAQYCDPDLVFGPASGLYVMLRAAYQLPESLPIARAQVFGGWVHPSVNAEGSTFDMSWPVRFRGSGIHVERCRGYMMGRYDALGEARYFAQNFPLRSAAQLDGAGETDGGPAIA